MKKLFTRNSTLLKEAQEPYVPKISPCQRIYCIGDIHGRYDLLLKLHQIIIADAADYEHTISIIYIGDYIDRGSDSKRVIDYLLSDPLPSFDNIFLLGNHEQVLLEFLHNPDSAAAWFSFGGLSTLASYGVKFIGIPHAEQLHDLSKALQEKISASHLQFFQQLLPYYKNGGYYFVHAGVRPGVKLKNQRLEDMLWIRDKFLDSQRFHGKVIVHGHSVSEAPVVCPNRIGVDTGAYCTGILSCLVLEEDKVSFLSTDK